MFTFILKLMIVSFSFAISAEKIEVNCLEKTNQSSAPVCLGIGGKPNMIQNKNSEPQNVLGKNLEKCGLDPLTGFYRTGSCQTGPEDRGTHTVCAVLTEEFLQYTKSKGNDLSTPMPQYGFPGLNPGQRWCLCAARWFEAHKAGKAPHIVLSATHQKTLEVVPLEILKLYENK